jgi:hypothetical protein
VQPTRAFALGAATAFALAVPAIAGYDRFTDPPVVQLDLDERDIVAETHLYCMALAVYFEGGSTGESERGQRHIARVVHERAKANKKKWGGSDICDVVFYKRKVTCQFSFACLPLARRTPRPGAAWQYSMQIARDELEGRSALKESSIRYYMNAALTPDRNACRFRKEFVRVVEAGRHEFFREPTPQELAALSKTKWAECERYAAALEKAKRKAALKAKKAKKSKVAAQSKSKKGKKKVTLAKR